MLFERPVAAFSELSARYFSTAEDRNNEVVKTTSMGMPALWGSARHGERKIRADYREPRSLPLSMELLRRASEDLLSEYRYEDALVLLDFVHPEIWPYDHLLRSLAERAKDPAVQMAKHQKLVNLTLSFLKSREELIEKAKASVFFHFPSIPWMLCKSS